MVAFALTPSSLAVLRDPVLDLPKTRVSGDFGDFLEQIFTDFFDRLDSFENPLASLIAARSDQLRALSTSLMAAWRFASRSDLESAYLQLDAGLRHIRHELISMSRRHSENVLRAQCWYRLAAWEGCRLRKHMFHVPYNFSHGSYRFSTPEAPTLYLANSVYLCWLECGEPALDRCFVSRFEIDTTGFEFLDIPSNHQAYTEPLDYIPGRNVDPRRVSNSPYREDVLVELADYLAVWPLLAAVSVRKREPAPEYPSEYVLPQLLLRWTLESENFLGIRYFTSKDDPSYSSQDWSVNLAVPARTKGKVTGYCDFLKARVRCTEPQPLSLMCEKGSELWTLEAVERRGQRGGRVEFNRGNTARPYQNTEYGKMEYWLDRPELSVGPIESD